MSRLTLLLLVITGFFSNSMYSQAPLFTASPTSICQGNSDSVFFTSLYPNLLGYTYNWQFGDGVSEINSGNTQHNYPNTGTYPASLTITGNPYIYVLKSVTYHYLNPIKWRQFPFDVNVDPYIKVIGCQSNQNNLNTNAGSTNVGGAYPNYTQYMNHPMGLQCYTMKVYDYDATGADDLIRAFVINIPGGSGSFSDTNLHVSWVIDSIPLAPYVQNITVNPEIVRPVILLTGTDTICSGDSVLLGASSSQGMIFQWYRNGNQIPNATSNIFYAKTIGDYTVMATDPNSGCQALSALKHIEVRNISIPILNMGPTVNLCPGDTAWITGIADPGVSYHWYKDNYPIAGADSNLLGTSLGGVYKLEVRNTYKCNAFSVDISINIIPLPQPTISQQSNHVLITGVYSSYAWMMVGSDSILSTDSTFIPSKDGEYVVQVTNANGCVGISSAFLFSTTGIEDLPELLVKIYPNPCIDYCWLELPKINQGGKIDIYDLQGRNLMKEEFTASQTGGKYQIKLSGMAEGVYLVRIQSNNYQPLTKRLVIRK